MLPHSDCRTIDMHDMGRKASNWGFERETLTLRAPMTFQRRSKKQGHHRPERLRVMNAGEAAAGRNADSRGWPERWLGKSDRLR